MGKTVKLAKLNKDDQCLVREALAASKNAYAPYSGFAVGAAVRTKSGRIYSGANIENAAYAVVTCAEISAIAAANAAGDFNLAAIAVAGHKFYPSPDQDASQLVTPCGRCRQAIFEASEISGGDVRVFSANGDLSQINESSISELLPHAFGPKTLGLTKAWPKMQAALHTAVAKLEAASSTPLRKEKGKR